VSLLPSSSIFKSLGEITFTVITSLRLKPSKRLKSGEDKIHALYI
jgi:hypothetical protein